MDIKKQVNQILGAMTLKEKIECLSGFDTMYTTPLLHLGLPALHMADSSTGLRDEKIPATAFPASVCLAATWNRELSAEYGRAVAEEFSAAGVDVLLGPGVNMYRVAKCGRNFEYCGEDPFLAAELMVPYVKAAQQVGVACTVKHFACNNSDWHRCSSNSVVDERTLHEIYFPVFERVIKEAKVQAVMTSYNKVNGEYAAQSKYLVTEILQQRWGFEGLVMSDWEGLWEPLAAMTSGLHLEMPGNKVWTLTAVKYLLDTGAISPDQIDEKIKKILTFVLEVYQTRREKIASAKPKNDAHAQVALQTAREGIVLLKNEGILPLDKPRKVSVVGPFAEKTPTSGGGAALVTPVMPVSVKDAILHIAPTVEVCVNADESAMADSDAVVVVVGYDDTTEGEGFDRPFELPAAQNELILRATAANPNTIVVVTAGGGVSLAAWHDQVKAILHQWYPGQSGTVALAEILFGQTNPSGKLPITIEKQFEDSHGHANYLPEDKQLYDEPVMVCNLAAPFDVVYEEGVFMGYRHYDASGIEPQYCFGHGLSYSTFEYSGLSIQKGDQDAWVVTFNIKNTGNVDGRETAQLYIKPAKAPVKRPVQELKGFAKVSLKPGETKQASIQLNRRAFAYYDINTSDWAVAPGEHTITIGSSSRDIRLNGSLQL